MIRTACSSETVWQVRSPSVASSPSSPLKFPTLGSMALHRVEKRLERLVEGAFARVFRTELRPVELGRRVTREMDVHVTIGVRGERVAPNHIQVLLNPDDYARFQSFSDALVFDLADAVEEHAKDEGYLLKGPSVVELIVDGKQHIGQFDVKTAIAVSPDVVRPSGWLHLQDGTLVAVTEGDPVSIGRMPDCDVTVADSNVSRHHAEVRLLDGHARIVDLGSMNGTKLNGRGVPSDEFGSTLEDGDQIQVGPALIIFSRTRSRV